MRKDCANSFGQTKKRCCYPGKQLKMSVFNFHTASGNTAFGGTANIRIQEEPDLADLIREIKRLQIIVQDQELQLQKLQEMPTEFTKQELKLLIQKMHPDKNNGSDKCAILFKKLMDIKNV